MKFNKKSRGRPNNSHGGTAFKKAKNRKTKQTIVFDENARTEYLTGFKKRKDERKRIGHEQAERLIKEEKRRLKQKRKEFMEKKVKHQALPEDLAEMAKQHVTDLEDHTVTITDITEVDLAGQGGLRLGVNKFDDNEEEEETKGCSGSDNEDSDDDGEGHGKMDKSKTKPEPSVKQKKKILKNIDRKIQQKEKLLKLKKNSKGKKRKLMSKKKKHKQVNPAFYK